MDHFSPYFGKSIDSITVEDIESFFKDEHKESNRIEFKSYRSGGDFDKKLDQIILSICAFLNSEGGIIIWGAPEGKKIPNKEEKVFTGSPSFVNIFFEHDKLINKISDRITPLPSGVSIRVIGEKNKFLYLFEIQASMTKPHQTENKYMIRLDGQSRIAPHYYIEAMFKQIKYPDLEGFIKFGTIKEIRNRIALRIETIIFNWSHFQNEKNVSFLILSTNGVFARHTPGVNTSNKYQEYGLDGHQSLTRKLDDILCYGAPLRNSDTLMFEMEDIITGREGELNLRFGGESSPQKESFYKFRFSDFKNPVLIITALYENRLTSEINSEIGINKNEVIKNIIGR